MNMTRDFNTKKEALAFLEDNPLHCVAWYEGKKRMSAIYWRGKRRIQPFDAPVK